MIAIPVLEFGSIDLNAFRKELRAAIAVFVEIDQAIKDRIVDYLITGHDVEVLLDLRDALRKPNRPKFFKLEESELIPQSVETGVRLYELFNRPVTPDGYYQRLGQVCSQYAELDRALYRNDSRLPIWFNSLIRFSRTLLRKVDYFLHKNIGPFKLQAAASSLTSDELDQLMRVILVSEDGPGGLSSAICQLNSVGDFLEANIDRLFAVVGQDTKLIPALIHSIAYHYVDPGHRLAATIDYGLSLPRNSTTDFYNILQRLLPAARPILLQRLTEGPAFARERAAHWLNRMYGRAAVPELTKAIASETDSKIREAIESLVAVYHEADEYQRALADQLSLPLVAIEIGELPLPRGFAIKFQKYLDEALAVSREQYKRQLHDFAMQEPIAAQPSTHSSSPSSSHSSSPAKPSPPVPPSADDLLALYLFMEGKSFTKPARNPWLFQVLQDTEALEQWCRPDELKLMHMMRMLEAIGSLQERSSALAIYHFKLLNAHRLAQPEPYGLREMDAAAEHLLGQPHLVSRGYLLETAPCELEDAAVWPAYVDQLKLLQDSIAGIPLDQYDRLVAQRRQKALAIAAMLPVLPRQIEDAAWALALADGWTLRPLARRLLSKQANYIERAIAGLKNRSGGARMGAAEILQEAHAIEAIDPLKKALNKEKHRPVQGVLLAALEKLGANLDEFVGREKLLYDATRADQRSITTMCWFPMDKVPVVRWASDNVPLPKIVMRWWLIQCVMFKSTTCSPVMRLALQLCRRDDTLRLAHFILDQWIGFDTDEPERIEVEKRYRAKAADLACVFKWAKKDSPKAIEDYITRMVNQEMRDIQRQQSAHSERGLLAIVAAFGDAACVDKMEKYIRNYHGNRALQAKSMLEVIPQIDAPNSLRVIRSLAAGFRNAAICKRAGELFREMSEQRGWTEDELAERILPDAGFATSSIEFTSSELPSMHQVPTMIVSYGRRQFYVIVNDDFDTIVLRDDGTRVKDLPTATKDDDRTLVRIAKEHLKTSRAILRSTKDELTNRLYIAMCGRRGWSVQDWRELLADHVLASIACRRLIWSIQSPGNTSGIIYFQVLQDGSTCDAHGQRLDLASDGVIRVAHPYEMETEVEQFWANRLATQGIRPLFPQNSQWISEQVGPF